MRKLISLMTILITSSTAPISVVACSNPYTNDLSKILADCDLKTVDAFGMPIPTEKELDDAIHNKKPNIDVNALKFEAITANSATVIGDGTTYTGKKVLNFELKKRIPITDIVKNGYTVQTIIETDGKAKPSQDDVLNVLKKEFKDKLNVSKVSIKNANQNSATLTGDGTIYTGTAMIQYTISKVTELSKIITNPNIDAIETHGKDLPDTTDVVNALTAKYQTLNTSAIKIDDITNHSAKVTSTDLTIYTNKSVNIKFVTDKHLDFKSVLINTNLNVIHIDGKTDAPSNKQIEVALQANGLNPDLNLSYITIGDITESTAVISSNDQSYYKGDPITVHYQLNKSTDLSKIIPANKRDLGTFKFAPEKTKPVTQDITDKLKQYSLNLNAIKVENISATSVDISSSDQNVYTGSITLTYKVDNSIAIDSVITTKDLKTINTNGLPLPNKDVILTDIVSYNKQVNTKYITLSDITDHNAKVTGDGIHYSGSTTISFNIDRSTITNIISFDDYHFYKAKGGGTSNSFDGTQKTILANWTNYAKTWDEFTTIFPKLSFGENSNFRIWLETCDSQQLTGKLLTCDTDRINTNKTTQAFALKVRYTYNVPIIPTWHANLDANICIWHDDKNIYLNWHGSMDVSWICPRDSQFILTLPEADFHQ